jgi:type II secretory pathway pseudopilin PulG
MNTASHRSARVTAAALPQRTDLGFSLVETLVALLLILIVMSGVMGSMVQFTRTQTTVWNRSNMHGSVRSATELLQQEVGQAGRVSLPSAVATTAAISPGPQTVAVTSTTGMFVGENLVVDAGSSEETVTVTAVNSTTAFSAVFSLAHAANVPVTVRGGFATGIVPTTVTNGSTGSVLKVYGDINGDGHMVYVEYVCDTAGGNLYRNMMPFDSAGKQALNPSQVLLSNILQNPGGTPCFSYQEQRVVGVDYVVNVAISLTTQTQLKDPTTGQFQTETKALLNVAPRNVFDAWLLASMGVDDRVQPMPASVLNLLH